MYRVFDRLLLFSFVILLCGIVYGQWGSGSRSSVSYDNPIPRESVIHRTVSSEKSAGQFEMYLYDPNASSEPSETDKFSVKYPLDIEECNYDVRIEDGIAETILNLKFKNNNPSSILEGVFEFFLPAAVTPDGLSLWIEEQEVEGVAVEKEHARYTFRTIVEREIDPSLLEWKGNGYFNLRIYPFFPDDSRTVKIRYVEPITDNTFSIPVSKYPVKSFSSFTAKIRSDVEPEIVSGEVGAFAKSEDGKYFVSQKTEENYGNGKDIVLKFGKRQSPSVRIGTSESGETFFTCLYPLDSIRDEISAPKTSVRQNRIAVYWDASGSQENVDHAKKIEFLKRYFREKNLIVDLIVFHDYAEPVRSFRSSDPAFYEALGSITYDGGTNPEALNFRESGAELALLFTDGIFGVDFYGTAKNPKSPIPVHIIAYGKNCNNGYLSFQAGNLNGRFVDLNSTEIESAIERLAAVNIGLVRIESLGKGTEDIVFTRYGDDSVMIAGKMLSDTVDIRLHFGVSGKSSKSVFVNLAKSLNNEQKNEFNELSRRIWTNLKLYSLLFDEYLNGDEIRELGLKYGFVGPGTSLISLESARDYYEFDIVPPKTSGQIYEEYLSIVEEYEEQEESLRANEETVEDSDWFFEQELENEKKLAKDALVRDWNILIKWWEHKYEYPSNDYFNRQFDSRRKAFGSLKDRSGTSAAQNYKNFDRHRSARYRRITDSEPMPVANYGGGGGYAASSGLSSNFDDSEDSPISDRERSQTDELSDVLKDVDPKTAFLDEISTARKRSKSEAYSVYLKHRKNYGSSPMYYVLCSDLFRKSGDGELAIRIIGNVHELGFYGYDLNMYLGLLYSHWNMPLYSISMFESVSNLEYLSYARSKFAKTRPEILETVKVFAKRLDRYVKYPSFMYDISTVELIELNRAIAKLGADENLPIDKRLVKPIDADLRIVVRTSDFFYLGLSVMEPHGEIVRHPYNLSVAGGTLSEESFSPFEYMIRNAKKGKYKIVLENNNGLRYDHSSIPAARNYRNNRWNINDEMNDVECEKKSLIFDMPKCAIVDIYTNYGRTNEKHRSVFLDIDDETEIYDLGEIEF